MGIGLLVFFFVITVVGICAGTAWGAQHAIRAFLVLDSDERGVLREKRLTQIRLGLIAAGTLVLVSGFVFLPILFFRGASASLGKIVPIFQMLSFLALLGISAVSESVFRRPHGEGRALWRLTGRLALLEGIVLLVGMVAAALVLLAPHALLAHFGRLRWWEPYFLLPLSALAVATLIGVRALALPYAIRRVFRASPLVGGETALAIAVAHGAFQFSVPKVFEIPWDGSGRVTANRRGLFGRHYGWKNEVTFVTAELAADLSNAEMAALARREVAHRILHTARARLLRQIAIGESLLLLSWIFPKLQVPLAVEFGFDARMVRLWVPLLMGVGGLWAALRTWARLANEDERRADLYSVEVLNVPLVALSHGLRKVFAGTIAEANALDMRLAAIDQGLKQPATVRLLAPDEVHAMQLRHRRLAFGAAGGFALLVVGISISPYGQRSVLQWRVTRAIGAHDAAAVTGLLAKGASPNRENVFGISPVSAAAGSGDLDLLRALVAHGGAVQNETWTKQPLHAAAAQGRIDVIAFLLEKGAQVNAPDFNGRTALMTAAGSGRSGTVNFLIQHGARLSARDRSGQTALQLAEGRGDREIARILRHASTR